MSSSPYDPPLRRPPVFVFLFTFIIPIVFALLAATGILWASVRVARLRVPAPRAEYSLSSFGGSLWNDESGLRYVNRKAMHVGDLITILVTESSEGSNRSTLRTKKESKFEAEGGPGAGPLSFIPLFGAKTDVKDEMNGSGTVSLSGMLETKITAQVLEIRPNGHLVIEGSRLLEVNGEEDRITLHGVARPEDIQADNTILSTYLAEARISYSGKGSAHHASRRGIFQRLLGWIF